MSTLRSISASTSAGGSSSIWRVKVRPLFCTASLVAGGLVSMSEPAKASTYFHGGSSGFFVPVLAKIISCFSGSFLSAQNSLVHLPDALGVDDADLPLGRAATGRGTCFSVYTSTPADEDAVDRLEAVQRLAAAGAAPDGVAGGVVLPRARRSA